MKRAEWERKKWYTDMTGEEWVEGKPLPTGLTDSGRQIGDALYKNYRNSMEAWDAMRIADRLDTENTRRAVKGEQNKEAQVRMTTRDAVGKAGLAGTWVQGWADDAVQQNSAEQVAKLWSENKQRRDARYRTTDHELRTQQAETERTIRALQDYADRQQKERWLALKREWEKRLPDMTSRYEAGTYDASVIEGLYEELTQKGRDLGRWVEEGASFIEALPKHTYREDVEHLYTDKGYMAIDKKALTGANRIQYEGGAGIRVSPMDVLTLSYQGKRYNVRVGDVADEGKTVLLNGVAHRLKLPKTAGLPLVLGERVYCYDGEGAWRVIDANGDYAALIRAIKEEE